MGSRSLGPRLTAISQHINICIDNIVNQPRDLHLWDCCCDHGFLGRSFLSQPSLHTVHFVDRISSIMQQLDTKLAADCLPDQQARAQTHIGCAADITLDTQAQHIVVLAGIGGNTLIELLDGIYQRHNASEQQIIFALCPNYHCYDVRRYLQQQYFELISEAYIQDRNKSHEIMLVGSAYCTKKLGLKSSMISSTGQFWQKNDTQQMAYLQTLISHHQKKQRFSADNRNTMLNDYQNLQQTLQQQNRATQSSSTAQATT